MTRTFENTPQREWSHTAQHNLGEAKDILRDLRKTWRLMKEKRQQQLKLSELQGGLGLGREC